MGYSPWGHKESDTTWQLNGNKEGAVMRLVFFGLVTVLPPEGSPSRQVSS